MKTRLALTGSAAALFSALSLSALSACAVAQPVSGGGYYYGPPPAYGYPPPPGYGYPPPAYYYPAPTYYYPPPPTYYYPAPAYYQQPNYLVPGIGLNFVFGFGGGHHGGHRWHH